MCCKSGRGGKLLKNVCRKENKREKFTGYKNKIDLLIVRKAQSMTTSAILGQWSELVNAARSVTVK